MAHRIIVILLLLINFCFAKAQFYTTGADPWNVKFDQIQRQQYRIVFDKQVAPSMPQLINIADSVAARDWQSLNHQPKPIDIILHSRTAYSNGLVTWAPKRIELYSFASQDDDCIPWFQHLLTHEYRHVVQTSSLNKGFTRFLYYLFGQQVVGGVLGIYIPSWVLEGDAVAQETALSHGGRGRSGAFEQETRAFTLLNHSPKYDIAYNGSLRQQVPDYYHMGYLTISATRLKYGPSLWANTFEYCGRKSWSITPFNRILRRQTGLKRVELYNQAMAWWTDLWQKQDESIIPTTFDTIISQCDDYDNYLSPRLWRGNIISYKYSPETLNGFVIRKPNGHDKFLKITSLRNEADFDIAGDTIVWCERRNHVRWENASESCIMIGNLQRNKYKRITRKGFFAAPRLSPDKQLIATIMTDRCNIQYIKILNVDGKEIKSIPFANGNDISSPIWTDNQHIAFIKASYDGKSICSIDIDSKQQKQLTTSKYQNIRHLHYNNSYIYFTNDSTGIDNIYSLSLINGNIERITSARFGADWASVYNDSIIYTDYSDKGYKIVATKIDTRPTDNPISPMRCIADSLTNLEGGAISIDTTLSTSFEQKKYSRFNLINIHSWGPINVDASSASVEPAIAISSQNLRGTTILNAGAKLHSIDSDEVFFASLTYNALFPCIKFEYTWGYEKYEFEGYAATNQQNIYTRLTYCDKNKTTKLKLNISQPLNFNSGAWLRHIEPFINSSYSNKSGFNYYMQNVYVNKQAKTITPIDNPIVGTYDKVNNTDIAYGVYFYLLRRQSSRDIGTRLGISAQLINRQSIAGADLGSCKAIIANLYLPGIGRHHQICFCAQAQEKNYGEIYTDFNGNKLIRNFSDIANMPRGYGHVTNNKINLLRANYQMPLSHPDWSLGGFTFIKRISANLFYDVANVHVNTLGLNYKKKYESTGIELNALTHWLRLSFPVNIGYRFCYLNNDNKIHNELLFSISFN